MEISLQPFENPIAHFPHSLPTPHHLSCLIDFELRKHASDKQLCKVELIIRNETIFQQTLPAAVTKLYSPVRHPN